MTSLVQAFITSHCAPAARSRISISSPKSSGNGWSSRPS